MENLIPLSTTQQFIWFDEKINDISPKFNIGGYVEINGELDYLAFKYAINRFFTEQDVFNFRFIEVDGKPYQVKTPELFLPGLIDSLVIELNEFDGKSWMTADMEESLDTQAKTFKTRLIHISQNQHFWYLKIHHILIDGWGFALISKKVSEYYNAFLDGQHLPSNNKAKFEHFLEKDLAYSKSPEYKSDKEYWQTKLKNGNFTPLKKNIDRGIGNVRESISLSRELYDKITAFCKNSNVTLFQFFLGCSFATLLKVFQKKDGVILVPVLNRQSALLKDVIGVLMNLMPVQVSLNQELQFITLVKEIKNQLSESYRHHSFQFSELHSHTKDNENIIGTRCDVRLSYEKYDYSLFFQGCAVQIFPLTHGHDTDPLAIFIREYLDDQPVTVDFNFNRQYFSEEEQRAFYIGYESIINQCLEIPDIVLGNLNILPDGERERILNISSGQSASVTESSLLDLLANQAKKRPSKVAVISKSSFATYSQVESQSNRLANLIIQHFPGIRKNIAILTKKSEARVITIFAVMKSGGTFVPLDPSNPIARLRHIFDDASCCGVIADSEYMDLANSLTDKVIDYGDLSDQLDILNQNSHDGLFPAYIMYTSGTSGVPNGVAISHHSILDYSVNFVKYFKITSDDKVVQQASIAFDASLEEIFPILIAGGTLIISDDEKDFYQLSDLIASFGVTIISTNPYFIDYLNTTLNISKSLRLIISGGAELKPDYCNNLIDKVELYNTYGPTETTICATFHKVIKEETLIPIGRPIANRDVFVMDDYFHLLPIGIQGEICISGSGLLMGYYNNPDLTSSKLVPHPFDQKLHLYRTGDLGRYRLDGTLEFLGRRDNQVKIAGFRIELEEIERAISQNESVKVAKVLVSELNGIAQLVAYVIPNSLSNLSTKELKETLVKQLPYYMIPNSFIYITEFPLNSNGKIAIDELPEPVLRNSDVAIALPRNPLEQKIAVIWESLLQCENIGIFENFFDLGGNSLRANSFLARLHKETGFHYSLKQFFSEPFIGKISENLFYTTSHVPEITRVSKKVLIPASYEQERIWFIQKLDPKNRAYYVPRSIRVTGPLNVKIVEKAMTCLIERHEILRTVFFEENGLVFQKVLDPYNFKIHFTDLSIQEAHIRKLAEEEMVKAEGQIEFNLEDGPLLRIRIIKNSDLSSLIVFCQHHLIHDGWTQGVLLGEFMQIYHSLYYDKEITLQKLDIQFSDYAYWQRNILIPSKIDMYLAYWKEKLANVPVLLNLPFDRPRPAVFTGKGGLITVNLTRELSRRLRSFSKDHAATLHVTMVSIFKILIYNLTGEADFCIGGSFAKRRLASIEGMLGMVINTLPLRTPIRDTTSFLEYLEEVKTTCLEALEYEETPFGELLNILQVDRNLSYLPLIQVAFGFMDTPTKQFILPELDLSIEESHNRSTKFDLMFLIVTPKEQLLISDDLTHEEIIVEVEYNKEIFDHDTIEKYLNSYCKLLSDCICNPKMLVNEFEIIAPDEKFDILNKYIENTTPIDGVTVHATFKEQVLATPNKIAIRQHDREISFAFLNEKITQLSISLKYGRAKHSIIGVYADRSIDMIIAIFAIMEAGAAYLPLDPVNPDQRVQHMLDASECKLLIVQEKFRSRVGHFDGEVLILEEAVELSVTKESENENWNQDHNLAYVIYTSGSTGKPKGCCISHINLLNYVQFANRTYFEPYHCEQFACFSSLSFDLTITSIFCPLLSGKCINLFNEDIIHLLPTLIGNHFAIDAIKLTPSHLKILNGLSISSSSVKVIVVGGEELTVEHVDIVRGIDNRITIINEYGPTETTVGSTYHIVESEINPIPIGTPIDNTQIYILDNHNKVVPRGITGNIYISGACVSGGYLHEPELSLEKFLDDPFNPGMLMYNSGDLGAWNSNGTIHFIGRKDQQIKMRGHRIELEEISFQLRRLESVSNCVVVANKWNYKELLLCGYYVAKKEYSYDTIYDFLVKSLPSYMIPTIFIKVESLPLSINGKIDTSKLPPPQLAEKQLESSPLRNKFDNKIASLWAEILDIDVFQIGLDSNFFKLGGHSLKANILRTKISKEFDVLLNLKSIFENPSVRLLSNLIKASVTRSFMPILGSECRHFYTQSSAQKRLYFLDQFENINNSYNIISVLSIEQELDLNRLINSLSQLVDRHESLRTTFKTIENEPVQVIHPYAEVTVSIIEFMTKGGAIDFDESLMTFIEPFNLHTLPLFKIGFGVVEEKNVIVIMLHHIISDGSSMVILQQDLINLYNNVSLDPLTVQYKDYTYWQESLKKSEIWEKQKSYWHSRLSGSIPFLKLSSDHEEIGNFSFSGKTYHDFFNEEHTSELFKIARHHNTTTYINVLAIFYIVLYKYTGEEDIIIGTGVNGRQHNDLHGIVGMFINMLPMRCSPQGIKSFSDFLFEVRATVLDAFDNQDYQFEDLVKDLNIDRSNSKNPLFSVSLVAQNYSVARNSNSLKFEQIYYKGTISKFDISIFLTERNNVIDIDVEYSNNLFKEEKITNLIAHIKHIVSQVSLNFDTLISDIRLSEPYNDKTLDNYKFPDSKLKKAVPPLLHEFFEHSASRYPLDICIYYNHLSYTYKEIEFQANQIANYLISDWAVCANELIGLILNNPVLQLTAIIGTLKAGAAYLPLDSSLPYNRLKLMIKDSALRILLSERLFIKEINNLQWECDGIKAIVCLDTENILYTEESELNGLMDQKLWDYVAVSTDDDVSGGGWLSSYTGEPFSEEEMDEYGENVLIKLRPYIRRTDKVMEIGVASGITMKKISPNVDYYLATDLSAGMIAKNAHKVENTDAGNVKFVNIAAHEISSLSHNGPFNVIILNSVVQCFHGHNYFRRVIRECLNLIIDGGVIFFGDIMDLSLKSQLLQSIIRTGSKGKTDLTNELFVSKEFFLDLKYLFPEISSIDFSPKIHCIQNELTDFRYDVIIKVDKKRPHAQLKNGKIKFQDDLTQIRTKPGSSPKTLVSSHDLAYMIYTSGSSGKPKGVLIDHQSISNTIQYRKQQYDFSKRTVCLQLFSYAFDGFITSVFTPLASGAPLVLVAPGQIKDLHFINTLIFDYQVSHFIAVPTFFESLIRNTKKIAFNNLSIVTLAGEKIEKALLTFVKENFPKLEIVNEYGVTEAAVMSSIHRHQEESAAVYIGRPVDQTNFFVVNSDFQLQENLHEGELVLTGIGIARGYVNDPEKTAEKFTFQKNLDSSPSYRTGDIVKLDGSSIQYKSRSDSQLKLRGLRIELDEISYYLKSNQEVKDAVVVPNNLIVNEEFICAYIVAKVDIKMLNLGEFLKNHLPSYMIPSRFIQIDSIPTLPNGKINLKALPRIVTTNNGLNARNKTDLSLIEIWSRVLGIERDVIGPESNFFDLGGHSLKATIVKNQIHKDLKIEVPLSSIFNFPTLSELSDQIEKSKLSFYKPVKKSEKKEYYPLTPVQENLFLFQQINNTSTLYNINHAVELHDIEKEDIENIMSLIIARHEIFRTSFHLLDGAPIAKIHADVSFEIDEVIVKQSELAVYINNFQSVFNLGCPPLMKGSFVNVEGRAPVLLLSIHHIIFDNQSLKVVLNEIDSLKNSRNLSEPSLQYSDYAAWLTSQINSDKLSDQRQFWQSKLQDLPPLVSLPIDFPSSAEKGYTGDFVVSIIDNTANSALKKLGVLQNTSVYVLLLTTLSIVLSKVCNQQAVVIGSTVTGRKRAEFLSTPGMFVNNIIFNINVIGGIKINFLLAEINEYVINAFEHQEYPVDRGLNFNENAAGRPLFNVMYNYLLKDEYGQSIQNIFKDSHSENFPVAAKFDLTLQAYEIDDHIRLRLEYNTSLFKKNTAESLLHYMITILNQMCNSLETTVEELNLMSHQNIVKLQKNYDNSQISYPTEKSILDIFNDQVSKWPFKVAIEDGSANLTYHELDKKSNQLANLLLSRNLKNSVVGVMLSRSTELIISILGIMKACCAYLPLDPDYPKERTLFILKDSNVSTIVTSSNLNFVTGEEYELINIEEIDSECGHAPKILPKPTDLAYIIYTSGTTGSPKGVLIEHGNVVRLLITDSSLFDFNSDDIWTLFHSHCFDFSVWEILGALFFGGKLVIVQKDLTLKPEKFIRLLATRQITVLNQTPSMFYLLAEMEKDLDVNLDNLRYVIFGGENLKPIKLGSWRTKYEKTKLINMFGITETTVHVTFREITVDDIYLNSSNIGLPIPTMSCVILGDDHNLLAPGMIGEIYVGGAGVSRGYLNRPELTHDKFLKNSFNGDGFLYKSGDFGRIRFDGSLEYIGRRDNQLKINGYRIELKEIEFYLLKNEVVREVFLSSSTEDEKNFITAYLVTKREITSTEIKRYLGRLLPQHMIPSFFVFLKSIPLDQNGKVSVDLLPSLAQIHEVEEQPSNEGEREILAIWSNILRIEQSTIGMETSFFELGGNSLTAIKMLHELKRKFSKEVNFEDFLRCSTIRELWNFLEIAGLPGGVSYTDIPNSGTKKISI